MKIKNVTEATIHFIETDEEEYSDYIRFSKDSYWCRMGESYESSSMDEDIEPLFQANRAETLVIPQGELLPCPFCGGDAQIIDSKILNVSNEQLFEIGCINDPNCPCWQDTELGSLMNSGFANIEIAKANWNKRART